MAITKIKKRYNISNYIVYAAENEMTFCDYCGKPVIFGMTDYFGDCHVHEECFEKYMNETYGAGKWKPTDNKEEDEYDGYYLFLNDKGEWEGTGIFYTEWEDDFEADWSYDEKRKKKYNFYINRKGIIKDCLFYDPTINYIEVYTGTDNEGNEHFKYFFNPTEDEIKWEVNDKKGDMNEKEN